MAKNSIINWKVLWILFIASIFGILAAMPFILTTQEEVLSQVPLPIPLFILLAVVQGGILFFVVILVGLFVSKKIGFGAPILERLTQKKDVKTYIKSILGLSIGLGVLAGILIIIGDYLLTFFTDIPPIITTSTAPIWQGFLASFYGGINEELLMRLFFMSLLIWLFSKIKKTDEGKPTQLSIWLAIFLAAILFGLIHLPLTASIMEITPVVIARAILLNGIGGVIFGWLYWRKGLESAIISHFSADILLYVIFPLAPL
jgi:membrane protease YdiL (CAAX protease family)